MNLKLKKGFDINLAGKAKPELAGEIISEIYSFKPTDFNAITRPKVLVNEGDTVKAGTPIFRDKKNEQVYFCAPVSGEVVSITRGAKRFPEEFKILADKEIQYVEFPKYSESDITRLSKEEVLEAMLKSGVWPNLVERPFGLVPNPDNEPRDIFISAFDTHPLAPDYEFVFKGQEKYLQAGVTALQKLTKGRIHISIPSGNSSIFKSLTGVQIHQVSGIHPAGNVGVQIHHIAPISRGEHVWTTTPYGLQQIGRLFLDGRYDSSKVIALAGSEVIEPKYYQIKNGISIAKLVENKLKDTNSRIVSGNVLTGLKVSKEDIIGFNHNLISVIPEGDDYEFLGWILPTSKKLSFHRAFGLFSFLSPKKERVLNTNMNGEERAIVQSGVFEQVLPMDIYPVFLLKAILANDFEEMEALGIYEVLEEDFALCEFVDVSKMEIQRILREGIDALQEA
jgi:Na+-transporting NADH:ubiquinone oxidoreductase subunit A